MFNVNENNETDRRILKRDYIRCSPAETSTIKTPNCQIDVIIPIEGSVISLLSSYLELHFAFIKKTDNFRFGGNNETRLVNLGPTVLFSNFKMTTSCGKHLEYISHAHIVSLMYKLLSSSRGSDDLSNRFDRDCGKRKDELTKRRI